MVDERGSHEDEANHDPEDDDGWDDRLKDTASAFRKAFGKRVRSVFNEDGIRGAVNDAIPREFMGYVIKSVDSAKDEAVRITGVQIRKFLENLDIGGELQKVLTSVKFEVRTTVSFVPNETSPNGVKPDSEVAWALRRGEQEVEVNASPGKVKAMREGLRSAVDSVMKTFGAGDEEEDEGEVRKRWNAMRSGLFAAVDTVTSTFDRDDDDEHDPGEGTAEPAAAAEGPEDAEASQAVSEEAPEAPQAEAPPRGEHEPDVSS